jgi:predicted 3-demethylubiquinone-9 3-methyltransferase (glyoxalase superfamily)
MSVAGSRTSFGLSWQINYAGLAELMTKDAVCAQRVMGAMMQMQKIDIKAFQDAANRLRE